MSRTGERLHLHLGYVSPLEFESTDQVAAFAAWSTCPPNRVRLIVRAPSQRTSRTLEGTPSTTESAYVFTNVGFEGTPSRSS